MPVPPLAPDEWFEVSCLPHWIAERRYEDVTSLTIDGVARLLPAAWRRRRRDRLYRDAVGRALIRNISDMQRSMRQTIDDTFRRLLASSHEAVESGIAYSRDLLVTARDRRRAADRSLDLDHLRSAERLLAELSEALKCRAQTIVPDHVR